MKKCSLPPTAQRVSLRTDPEINRKIRNLTIENLLPYQDASEEELTHRIHKLNKEWDVDRHVEAHIALCVMAASLLGLASGKKRWMLASGAIGLFAMSHALHGWCPYLPVIRRIGVRSAEEINHEKTALKMLRNDFAAQPCDVSEVLGVAEKQ